MNNGVEYSIFIIINFIVVSFIIIGMYKKRNVFTSKRDALYIIIFGLSITVSIALLNSYAQGTINFENIKSFVLMKEVKDNWILTRLLLFGFDILVAGLFALVLSTWSKKNQAK